MSKRVFDASLAAFVLIAVSPLLLPVCFLIYIQDRRSPFYIANRVGRDGSEFRMVKLRSMTVNAASSGIVSTSANDSRITPVGHFVRKTKLDEIPQLWNVLNGEMSLVGPRPQVPVEVKLYTKQERGLLAVRPGITDFSSIVFADEGEILAPHEDANLAYQQLIRPWKSRLGLFYIGSQSVGMDLKILKLTFRNSLNREATLKSVSQALETLAAPRELVEIALRQRPLTPHPPPGEMNIFSR